MDISVVVVTYNPDYKKLFSTLKSIVCQKEVTFEIVIADDGSKFFDEEKVRKWFEENNYKNYKLVLNANNQGTMKNAYSGWEKAEGKYIKQLSPGDLLYDEWTLKTMFNIAMTNNSSLVFGLAVSYKNIDNKMEIINNFNPVGLLPYINGDSKKAKNYYIKNKDFVNGMACLVKKSKLIQYGSLLLDKVKYGEDCTYMLMSGAGEKISYSGTYVIWYEFGDGVSTSKASKWKNLLAIDIRNSYKVLYDLTGKLLRKQSVSGSKK